MKNVLVTGAGTTLGRAVVSALRHREGVERVVGTEPVTSSAWIDGVEIVGMPGDHRDLVALLASYPIDTVIHCDLAPDRSGSRRAVAEARVVECMRLGAAIASPNASVAAWVLASSSSVYPMESHCPLLHRESAEIEPAEGSPAASICEAEDYARDVAARRPHLNVGVLRLQHLVGDGVRSPMTALLEQRVLPRVIGYDAPVQVLALPDAVRALVFAAELELAGVYNVASAGAMRWSEVLRTLDAPSVPVLAFEARGLLGSVARIFEVPHVPEGMLPVLRFGHALDTSKLAAAGCEPEHDQSACLAAIRAAR